MTRSRKSNNDFRKDPNKEMDIPLLKWRKANCFPKEGKPENIPSARCGHTLSIVGSNIFVFGGLSESISNEIINPNNELFMLRFRSAEKNEWRKIKTNNVHLPPPRWKHSASQVNTTEIVIFGGFACGGVHERLNDVWIFNAVAMEWRQSVPKIGSDQVETINEIPSPRGGHTSNMIRNEMYVFGGHGGTDHVRENLNDLYSLDTETWLWKKIHPAGKRPEERSGHRACVVGTILYVFGGRNSEKHFDDFFLLETSRCHDSHTWTKLEFKLPIPRWNHAGFAVDHNIFVFGGVEKLNNMDCMGTFTNSVLACDTNGTKNQWHHPTIVGEKPDPRADTGITYFEKESKIIVFGGFSNEWFSDLFILDISAFLAQPESIV